MSITFHYEGWNEDPKAKADEDFLDDLFVNVSNGNGGYLLGLLGFDAAADMWECPDVSPLDFKGRILVALGLNGHDEGVPARELAVGETFMDGLLGEVREGGPTFIDCGRREGYADERLVQLLALADYAIEYGSPRIYWG